MSLMREAWLWKPAPEYNAWALRQVRRAYCARLGASGPLTIHAC